jgi:hypothetical protein
MREEIFCGNTFRKSRKGTSNQALNVEARHKPLDYHEDPP